MKILLSSGSLYTLPLEMAFHIASETGYDGMEVIIPETFEQDGGPSLLRDLGEIAPIFALHAPFHPIPGWGDSITALMKTVDLAKSLSVPMVTFHPPKWLGVQITFWRWMYTIGDFQGELGGGRVTIAMENMPYRGRPMRFTPYMFGKTEDIVRFAEKRNLYFTFDCAHMGTTNRSFAGNFLRLYRSKRVKNIHLSDYRGRREHLLPGHGDLPLEGLLKYLRESDYEGMITLETIPEELPADEADMKRTLGEMAVHIRDQLK